jgi:putative oxidoreductase
MRSILKPITKTSALWDSALLILRIWLGYQMIHNGRFFYQMFSSKEDRDFFEGWFGHLHIPFPLFMAFVAKGAEFFGGILILFGFYARVGAFLIAFTMLVATLVANIGKNWEVDGTITVSYCVMAVILIYWGGGKYAIESLFKKADL